MFFLHVCLWCLYVGTCSCVGKCTCMLRPAADAGCLLQLLSTSSAAVSLTEPGAFHTLYASLGTHLYSTSSTD